MAVAPFSSTFSLPTFTLPTFSSASWSTRGVICRQGPHQTAQKSTSTGLSDCRTSLSHSASVKFSVFAPAICVLFVCPSLVIRLLGWRKVADPFAHPALYCKHRCYAARGHLRQFNRDPTAP